MTKGMITQTDTNGQVRSPLFFPLKLCGSENFDLVVHCNFTSFRTELVILQ